jgi:FixJ family two-component response regulator
MPIGVYERRPVRRFVCAHCGSEALGFARTVYCARPECQAARHARRNRLRARRRQVGSEALRAMSLEEVAQELGLSPTAVQNIERQALRKLREALSGVG